MPRGSADFDVSATLLGGVALMMVTAFFLNTQDKRLQTYTWNVLNNTMAFFIAVMFCTAGGDLVSYFILRNTSSIPAALLVTLMQFVFWLCVLTLGIAYLNGAIGEAPAVARTSDTQLNIKAWGGLFSKVCSWASIGFFGLIQQHVPANLVVYLLLLLADVLMLCFIFWVFRRFRLALALADDNRIDYMEREWTKMSENMEDAVMSVLLSFQIVQVVRFCILGELPLPDGSTPFDVKESAGYMWCLLCCGVVFVSLAACCQLFASSLVNELQEVLDEAQEEGGMVAQIAGSMRGLKQRIVTVSQTTTANCAAWCLLFIIRWYVPGVGVGKTPAEKLWVAFVITVISYAIIFALDKAANLNWDTPHAAHKLAAFINPFSLTIATGWKIAFVAAMNEVTLDLDFMPQALQACLTAIVFSVILVPIWKDRILQTTLAIAAAQDKPLQPAPVAYPPVGTGYAKMTS
mmetsp:Transcript_2497/g.6263  ORF Transcript_2497/g.6263 Transcript_2497/m.6263 type:complete len:462 (-) Transcript_2497:107-1492(-)